MKKSLVMLLVVSSVLSTAGTAMAFSVDFNGDFRLQGRNINDTSYKDSFFQFRTRIGFEGKIDDNTTFFGRFGAINKLGGEGSKENNAAFDQYGVKLTDGKWKYSVGRQAVNLGLGAIISTGSDAAYNDNKFDGIVASTSGPVNMNLIAGKTTANTTGSTVAEWYGIDVSTKLGSKVIGGLAYASKKDDGVGNDAINYFSANTTIMVTDKLSFNGEFAKSDYDDQNKAYFLSGTYSRGKGSLTVQYNDVKANAVDAYSSGIGGSAYPYGSSFAGQNYKGLTYSYTYNISKAKALNVTYLNLKNDSGSQKSNELIGSMAYSF
ncbi:MAG: hypothetical protein H6Q73_1758 [Firmicutes bacterium]|nr:hypothetical protein [Bacillota bacterium]